MADESYLKHINICMLIGNSVCSGSQSPTQMLDLLEVVVGVGQEQGGGPNNATAIPVGTQE